MTGEHSLYKLRNIFNWNSKEIDITKADYHDANKAREILSDICEVEEKFYLICEAYRDLEEFYFSSSMKNVLYDFPDGVNFNLTSAFYSQKATSFLSSTYLYAQSLPLNLKRIMNRRVKIEEIDQLKDNSYGDVIEIVDLIRNHSQHHSIPVNSASHGGKWSRDMNKNKYFSKFYFNISELNDRKVGRGKIDNLKDRYDKIDLRDYFQKYFYFYCDFHVNLREFWLENRNFSIAIIEKFRGLWISTYPQDKIEGLVACAKNDEQGYSNDIYLDDQLDEYRAFLEFKILNLKGMSRRAVEY